MQIRSVFVLFAFCSFLLFLSKLQNRGAFLTSDVYTLRPDIQVCCPAAYNYKMQISSDRAQPSVLKFASTLETTCELNLVSQQLQKCAMDATVCFKYDLLISVFLYRSNCTSTIRSVPWCAYVWFCLQACLINWC